MPASTYRVRVAGSEHVFDCAATDTVLRAAQRAGLPFPYECNVGSCANCKFELVEGEVAMRWPQAPAWTERDRQRRRFLGCQAEPRADCTIKLRLDERYAPPHRPRHVAAVLQARRDLTHALHEFSFRLDAPLRFEPGQYALAYLPGVAGARAWSMSNVVDDAGDADALTWQFVVRRVPGGSGSAALFDALPIGAQIELDGPYGMAWLRRDAPRDIVCIAGGSGLAPMLSIARAALAEPRLAGRALHFYYGARTPADVCGEDLLRALPGAERLHYVCAVSTPPAAAAGTPWTGPVGFVHDEVRRVLAPRLAGMEIYFAGPPPMATAVQRMLLDAGVPPAQTHFDAFY